MGAHEAKLALDRRRAGVLLHPTSLPGAGINGELGPQAFHFVDFLVETGLSVWQTLPLGPTHDDASPYHCLSAQAGSPLLISLELLVRDGWLDDAEAETSAAARRSRLRDARSRFLANADEAVQGALRGFVAEQAAWLDDYALYDALRQEQGGAPWWTWPANIRDRQPTALADARGRLAEDIGQVHFEQFVFFRQWRALKAYANERGVLLFGDMPIFVAHDSAEVWAHREYFDLDAQGQPNAVAGVPPDYFSETGQRWGNPLYLWRNMQADGFKWWLARMRTQLDLFDLIRIDHFRGFEAYWAIPAGEETAVHGRWVQAPGDELLDRLHRDFDPLPIVAEDLGLITPEVEALREKYRLPGMRVLQFAFEGGAANPYLPHRYEANTVVYTGTHDNDTTIGWYARLPKNLQERIRDYLGYPAEAMPWPLIRAAFASVARLAMLPMQDILMLGSEHRMNRPGTASGNWRWRFDWSQVNVDLAARMRHLTQLYGRDVPSGTAT